MCSVFLSVLPLTSKTRFYNYQPQPKYSWALIKLKGREISQNKSRIILTNLRFRDLNRLSLSVWDDDNDALCWLCLVWGCLVTLISKICPKSQNFSKILKIFMNLQIFQKAFKIFFQISKGFVVCHARKKEQDLIVPTFPPIPHSVWSGPASIFRPPYPLLGYPDLQPADFWSTVFNSRLKGLKIISPVVNISKLGDRIVFWLTTF